MTGGHSILGLVLARGGSKRMPNKNLLPLAGKSLIARTLETALAARHLGAVGFSSDDPSYLAEARACGIDDGYVRPAHLAQDGTSSADTVLHYLDWSEQRGRAFTHVLLLQPTSPFRTAAQIDAAVVQWRSSGRPSLVSVTPAVPPSTVMVWRRDDRVTIEPKGERGDAYILDGAIYITPVAMLRQGLGFWDQDSALYVNHYPKPYDIDTPLDFRTAEAMLGADLNVSG